MTTTVGLVLVSHSGNLAKGTAEVAAQMAPDVAIRAAGGTDDNRIGTSFDRVQEMVEQVRAGGAEAVVLADLGSALLTAESVAELAGEGVHVIDVPFVEGAVAAAVAAQAGGSATEVITAATSAIDAFIETPPGRPGTDPAVAAGTDGNNAATAEPGERAIGQGGDDPLAASGDVLTRSVTLHNSLGLHARPAAQVARMVADHDAEVTINDTPGASVLALMGLGLTGGAEVTLRASGPQANEVLDALVAEFENGFGEE